MTTGSHAGTEAQSAGSFEPKVSGQQDNGLVPHSLHGGPLLPYKGKNQQRKLDRADATEPSLSQRLEPEKSTAWGFLSFFGISHAAPAASQQPVLPLLCVSQQVSARTIFDPDIRETSLEFQGQTSD